MWWSTDVMPIPGVAACRSTPRMAQRCVVRQTLGVGRQQAALGRLGQTRSSAILGRQHGFDLVRPRNSERPIEWVDAVLTIGRIAGGAEVGDGGVLGQRHERMAEA